MSVEAESCFSLDVKKCASALVCIVASAMKVTVFTCGIKRERERESERICNPGNVGQRLNMHGEYNVCRYVIFW